MTCFYVLSSAGETGSAPFTGCRKVEPFANGGGLVKGRRSPRKAIPVDGCLFVVYVAVNVASGITYKVASFAYSGLFVEQNRVLINFYIM